jgi:hypothetical protein
MKKFLAVTLLASVIAAPAFADDAPGSSSDDQKVICKREKELGSNRAAKKVCMTRAEWKMLSDNTKVQLRNMRDRALAPAPIPGRRQ